MPCGPFSPGRPSPPSPRPPSGSLRDRDGNRLRLAGCPERERHYRDLSRQGVCLDERPSIAYQESEDVGSHNFLLYLTALDEFPVVDPLSLGIQREFVVDAVHLRVELLLCEDSQVHEVLIVHDPRPGPIIPELLLESLGEGPQVPPVDEGLL